MNFPTNIQTHRIANYLSAQGKPGRFPQGFFKGACRLSTNLFTSTPPPHPHLHPRPFAAPGASTIGTGEGRQRPRWPCPGASLRSKQCLSSCRASSKLTQRSPPWGPSLSDAITVRVRVESSILGRAGVVLTAASASSREFTRTCPNGLV